VYINVSLHCKKGIGKFLLYLKKFMYLFHGVSRNHLKMFCGTLVGWGGGGVEHLLNP
jgi:hypothetical protein